jgi:hypothetical protein
MQTYVSQREHFSISVPESWGVAETPHGNHGDKEVIAVIGVPGRSSPHGSLARKAFAQADIGAVAAWGESRVQTEEVYVEISLEPIRIAGLEGLQREYSWKSYSRLLGLATWRCQDTYVLHGTSGYALSLCADERHWPQVEPVFRQMIESFSVW